jgi:hypothetical protein
MPREEKNQERNSLRTKSLPVPPRFISLLKLVIFIFMLPLAFGYTHGLINALSHIEGALISFFWLGIFVFFITDLVICRLDSVYKKGQDIVKILFHFFAPLFRFAPYVLPIYTIFVLIFSFIINSLEYTFSYQRILLFFTGFSITLHLVYTLNALHGKNTDFLKASHFFISLWIYLINVFILALTFSQILPSKFSFFSYFRCSCLSSKDIYISVFNQIFLLKK